MEAPSLLPWQHLLNNYSTWYTYPAETSLTDALRELHERLCSVSPIPLLQSYGRLQTVVNECKDKKGRPYFRGSVFILLEAPRPEAVFYDTMGLYLRDFVKAEGTIYAWNEFHHDVIRLDFKKFLQSKLDIVR